MKLLLPNRKKFLKLFSILLSLATLNLLTGCGTGAYFKANPEKGQVESRIPYYYLENKTIVVHDKGEAWILEIPEIKDEQIVGYAKKRYMSQLNKAVVPEKSYKFNVEQSQLLSEVHIYTSGFSKIDGDKVSIPLKNVENVYAYEYDAAATSGLKFLRGLGTTAMIIGGFFVILLITSCPYVYAVDGNTAHFIGELYAGSVTKKLERHDFLKLPVFNLEAENYQLKISNELHEIQHTNLAELWVFNHDKNANVSVDKYGNPVLYTNLSAPLSAIDFDGNPVLSQVDKIDNQFYTKSVYDESNALTDGIELSFENPGNYSQAHLHLNARTSILLDYMMNEFYGEFGYLYKRWTKMRDKQDKEIQQQWTLDQNIPLTLSIEKNGVWEVVDYYNVTGSMAFKQDVLTIPLNDFNEETLKLKLESGTYLWEIDCAAVSFSNGNKVDYQVIQVNSASNENGEDIKHQLVFDDEDYYIQPEIGNLGTLDFNLPNPAQQSRTLYLHSKGWYQNKAKPKGKANIAYLKKFREPGRFNQFVLEHLKSLTSN